MNSREGFFPPPGLARRRVVVVVVVVVVVGVAAAAAACGEGASVPSAVEASGRRLGDRTRRLWCVWTIE
jgi:hypothetical protein